MIDIKGLDKAAVLAALHNGTAPLGLGFLRAQGDMTIEQARKFIDRGDDHEESRDELREKGVMMATKEETRLCFDYVAGRPLKCDISGDAFDERLYDRDAGKGAAARAIDAIRGQALATG